MFPIWIFVWEVPWIFAACLHHCLLHFFALTCCTAPGAFFHKFSFPMPYFVSIWFCMPLNCLGFCHILYFIVMPPIYFCYDGPTINVACCVICPLLPYLCYIPFVSIFSNLNSLPYWAYYLCIPHSMFPAWILVREVLGFVQPVSIIASCSLFALACCTTPGALSHKFLFTMPYFVSIWFCIPLICFRLLPHFIFYCHASHFSVKMVTW